MTYLRLLLLFYSALSIFIAGGLFFKKKDSVHLFLSLFTFLFGLEMFDYLYSTSEVAYIYPQFYGLFYLMIGFVYGPILCFHFRGLIFPEKTFSYTLLLHFIPLILIGTYYFDILMLPGDERLIYMRAHFLDRIMLINYARAGHLLTYGILFVFMIYRYQSRLTMSNRVYAIAACIIYFTTAVIISWLTLYADHWRQFILYYIVASSIVMVIGVILYTQPDFLEALAKKYLHSGIDATSMNRISQKINALFQSKKIYLEREFSIDKLASEIEEKPYSISQTFSIEMGENFNDFLNRHRVNHAQEMLRDEKYDHYKIEAIGIESGFNNKVTFNKAFSKFTSVTPSVFRSNRES